MLARRVALSLSLTLLLPALASADEHAPIGFQAVERQVYRGGRPGTMESMSWIAHHGIHTVVNLQGEGWQWLPGEKDSQIATGKRMAESLGMRFFHLPLPPGRSLDADGVKMLLDVVRVMAQMKRRVLDATGYDLHSEIRLVGFSSGEDGDLDAVLGSEADTSVATIRLEQVMEKQGMSRVAAAD